MDDDACKRIFRTIRRGGHWIGRGLSPDELGTVESLVGAPMPPDLRLLLSKGLPRGNGFPAWKSADRSRLRLALDGPREGILFDVEHAGFWWPAWGARPVALDDALREAGRALDRVPRLFPLYGHRYLPAEPCEAGNPVFSVVQTDVIHYGSNLEDYFRREFVSGWATGPGLCRTIPFWSDLVGLW